MASRHKLVNNNKSEKEISTAVLLPTRNSHKMFDDLQQLKRFQKDKDLVHQDSCIINKREITTS